MNSLSKKEYTGSTFETTSFQGQDLTGVSFEDCTFRKCDLHELDLSRTRFLDCYFESSDLGNTKWRNSRVRTTLFKECKLIGIQWVNLDDLVNAGFEECNLSFSNFSGMKLRKTHFLRSRLCDVDFSQADLSESNLRECDLLNAQFNLTSLLKCDFREARNYFINPLDNKIKGARFSMPEAQGLLAGLGIVLES